MWCLLYVAGYLLLVVMVITLTILFGGCYVVHLPHLIWGGCLDIMNKGTLCFTLYHLNFVFFLKKIVYVMHYYTVFKKIKAIITKIVIT